MGDDGIGLEMLARLQPLRPDARIEYVDGGTGGMELLPVVQDASKLLILDAVAGAEPGKVVQISGEELRLFLASKLSVHQLGLLDVMSAARLLGGEPRILEVVGVVPESVDMRVGLSESVAAAIDGAVARAAGVLDEWL
jgi:hydrogenase maturation protease